MVVPTPANPADRLAPSGRTAAPGPKEPPELDRHRGDLYIRTSWIDASLALSQLEKGRILGGAWALWARARLQARLASLGATLHKHAGKALFVAVLLLATFCVGLKSAQLHTRVDQLWIQEGGRLEAEMRYSRRALGGEGGPAGDAGTHQLAAQAARDPAASTLSARALLAHELAMRRATAVTVHMFDVTWRLRDLCYRSSVPNFDNHYIDQIFDRVIPCSIVTPLDCFWEGSKLLGPDYPVAIPGLGSHVQWTHLNPMKMVQQMKKMDFPQFPFSTLESYMKRAGVSSGYQEKPCLDPADPLCPETAPNKKSQQPPDVAAELSGGCYGFAAKYMHWPEELIVGGGVHNKSGGLQTARALQTVVQLMTERELYDYMTNDYRVHHSGWTREKAAAVLDAWQRKFSEEIHKFTEAEIEYQSYEFYAFSTSTLNDILGKYSHLSITKVAIGYVCILVYVAVSLVQWQDPVKSQAGVGIAGVLLLSITVAAGLGFCALIGIPFNASTMQIIPFLALGLGVDDMFLLTHAYAESPCDGWDGESCEGKTPAVLRTTGLSVLLTTLSNVCAFFAAALIPIPALRVFCLQAGILLLFNLASMLLVYPAMISLDMRRRSALRCDVLCCMIPGAGHGPPSSTRRPGPRAGGRLLPQAPRKVQAVTRALPPDRLQTVTSLVEKDNWRDSSKDPLDPEANIKKSDREPAVCLSLSWTRLARNHYAPFIMKPTVKVLSMLAFICILVASLWGATKVADGLELTDIVPQDTDEHKFLSIQGKYFGFYSMYAVTQGDFEYPTNQKLLYDYHESFVRVSSIIKNDNGGLPEFWLSLFRDWLIELQKAFDHDYATGRITQECWYANASDEAILAYKLLVQTGYVDNPIDKSLITQVRLVDGDGIINTKAFYNYLTAWVSNDAMAYSASQANLKPEPKQWYHTRTDYELKIPKSLPLVYTQLPFYLHGLGDTESIKTLITMVRNLCMKFEAKGLANFPSGIPFIFWEQYLHLRPSLALALVCALGAVLVVVGVLLLNVWAALLVVMSLAAMVLQLLGAMALLGIKLSAISAVLLIVAVGMGVHFTVHICLSFVTSIGSRDRRARLALEHMFTPVVHGAVTTFLAVAMLATSDFNFVTRYFFSILLALITIGLVNGLLFFPIILSLVGPAAEVIPIEHPDRISTPSPEASPVRTRRSSGSAPPPSHHSRPRPPSLTTITEEPNSHSHSSHHSSMQSIIVQPEVVVETTTYNTDTNSGSGRSTPTNTRGASMGGITTKVTATANIKVEVHTPGSNGERCHSRRSYYRERERERDRDRDRDRERERDRDRERSDRDRDYHDRDRDRDRDSYHDRENYRDRDRDSRERERDRSQDKSRDRDSYRDRDTRRDRDRDRDRDRYRDSHRESGRDSGHESDVSRH